MDRGGIPDTNHEERKRKRSIGVRPDLLDLKTCIGRRANMLPSQTVTDLEGGG